MYALPGKMESPCVTTVVQLFIFFIERDKVFVDLVHLAKGYRSLVKPTHGINEFAVVFPIDVGNDSV